MIQIKRCDPPRVLKGSPRTGTHYNKRSVVKRLWEMQHGKCCYCEQKIPEKGHMKAVEHFRPKSMFKSKKNHWPNLLLACAQCNGKKSDKFPLELTNDSGQPKVLYQKRNAKGKPLIIDPSAPNVDPEEYISFDVDDGDVEFGCAKAKGGGQVGSTTIATIGLSDSHYVRERKSWYRTLTECYALLIQAEDQGEEELLRLLKMRFAMLLSAAGRFAGFCRAYARTKKKKLKVLGLRIPKDAELADSVLR